MRKSPILACVCFALAAASWASWFGWDTVRDVDPVTGDSHGPYEIWQGVGAAGTLAVIIAVCLRRLGTWWLVAAISLGFTAGFTWTGATDPESDGLYVIGAGMLLVLMLVSTSLVVLVARWAVGRRRQP